MMKRSQRFQKEFLLRTLSKSFSKRPSWDDSPSSELLAGEYTNLSPLFGSISFRSRDMIILQIEDVDLCSSGRAMR